MRVNKSSSLPDPLKSPTSSAASFQSGCFSVRISTPARRVGGFLALRVSVKNLLLTAFFRSPGPACFAPLAFARNEHWRSGCAYQRVPAACIRLLFVFTSRAGTFKINRPAHLLIALSLILPRLAFRCTTGADEPASRRALIIGSGPARCVA
jgi:hypothetical protein